MQRSGVHPSVRLDCLSVCPVGILTVTDKEASCDAASLHFGTTIRHSVFWHSNKCARVDTADDLSTSDKNFVNLL